ncbi:hypothetical protein HAX54_022575, partial [Datura stramonium]|nr:hypothetical protein [Datura stramonium]
TLQVTIVVSELFGSSECMGSSIWPSRPQYSAHGLNTALTALVRTSLPQYGPHGLNIPSQPQYGLHGLNTTFIAS